MESFNDLSNTLLHDRRMATFFPTGIRVRSLKKMLRPKVALRLVGYASLAASQAI